MTKIVSPASQLDEMTATGKGSDELLGLIR